ncbi:hypothetical protein PVAP13_3KG368500 [Panicum virgatum]|uniref:BHLH domain-containing protein n=2 Tax=Panicum virgatum TaxID=38727 RepID=A0A8T0UZ96_PANVG|nr:hypothetical protein PVAP13_3KG368500 [Panicum virgatum]
MADEWWSSARTGGDGASACSTVRGTDPDAAESVARSATETDYFRPTSLHVGAAAAASPPSFIADPAPLMVDWTQAYVGGRAAGAEATNSFNALLQLHGDDDTGRHFLLDRCQQPDVVDGAASVEQAAAASRSAPLYADKQYSSYGDVPATLMTRPFSPPPPQQQQHFSGLFGPSTRNFSDKPSVPPPMTTTKPLLLQALERKAFESNNEPVQDTCSSATTRSKKPRIATPSPLPTFKVRKEKLGDRITALQQLVSPFGKTDTASVLHEAI